MVSAGAYRFALPGARAAAGAGAGEAPWERSVIRAPAAGRTSRRPSALSQVELFRGLKPKELAHLERVAHPRHFAPGAVVVWEGRTGLALFVVLGGRLRVTQQVAAEGEARELRDLGPGEAFGELTLLTGRPRSATVTALEPTDCLALHRLDFLAELRAHPEVALRLLETLAQRLLEAERRSAPPA
jgi:CRP-like cAMP-binding protein